MNLLLEGWQQCKVPNKMKTYTTCNIARMRFNRKSGYSGVVLLRSTTTSIIEPVDNTPPFSQGKKSSLGQVCGFQLCVLHILYVDSGELRQDLVLF